jgi:hypothetical protein
MRDMTKASRNTPAEATRSIFDVIISSHSKIVMKVDWINNNSNNKNTKIETRKNTTSVEKRKGLESEEEE